MRRILITAALALSALTLSGCATSVPDLSRDEAAAPNVGTAEDAKGTPNDTVRENEPDSLVAVPERETIVTGWLNMTVEKPLDAVTEAIQITEAAGGRIDARNEYAPINGDNGSATLVLRLPADNLTAVLETVKKLGRVTELSLNTADVTVVTRDLEARISARSASLDRLRALLATANDTATLLDLETAITDRQGELESLESEQRYYKDQISLSTITLNLSSTQENPSPPDTFWGGLIVGWNGFLAFFAGSIVVLGMLVPWLALVALTGLIVLAVIKRRERKQPSNQEPPTPPEN